MLIRAGLSAVARVGLGVSVFGSWSSGRREPLNCALRADEVRAGDGARLTRARFDFRRTRRRCVPSRTALASGKGGGDAEGDLRLVSGSPSPPCLVSGTMGVLATLTRWYQKRRELEPDALGYLPLVHVAREGPECEVREWVRAGHALGGGRGMTSARARPLVLDEA